MKRTMYLDNAGAAEVDQQTLISAFNALETLRREGKLANPHSSPEVAEAVNECRRLIIEKLCSGSLDDYDCVFTSGTTAGCKLVAESLAEVNTFAYTKHNHNSVVGLRNVFPSVEVLDEDMNVINRFGVKEASTTLDTLATSPATLVAFPAECNFSGKVYDISERINKVKKMYGNTSVLTLVDAAKFITSNKLHLNLYKPEFVVFSLYKLLGYPTGLGCLLINKNASKFLTKKQYFGGGTYDVNISETLFYRPRSDVVSKLEDGTIDFMGIVAAKVLLSDYLVNESEYHQHIYDVSKYAQEKLKMLKHYNSSNVLEMYSSASGSIISFNILNSSGEYIGYKHVEKMLKEYNIQIRVGCFCNPGACSTYLGWSTEKLIEQHSQGHRCWDQLDLFENRPTGAVRVSIGRHTTKAHINYFVAAIKECFMTPKIAKNIQILPSTLPTISEIYVYPIKSLSGIKVSQWPITNFGLLYDRMFGLFDMRQRAINVQQHPKITEIQVAIEGDELIITHPPTHESFQFVIDGFEGKPMLQQLVNESLSKMIGIEVQLVKSSSNENFNNTSQLLLLNENSLDDLNYRILSKENYFKYLPSWIQSQIQPYVERIGVERFRPNFVVSNLVPYAEDDVKSFKVAVSAEASTEALENMFEVEFVSDGQCSRCYTTTIDARKKKRDDSLEPMKTLLSYRKQLGGIMFGQLFNVGSQIPSNVSLMIEVGSELRI